MQIDAWQPTETEAGFYNTTLFHRFTIEFILGDCSSSVGAYLRSALLLDRKHLLKPEIDMDCIHFNKFKLDREKNIGGGL